MAMLFHKRVHELLSASWFRISCWRTQTRTDNTARQLCMALGDTRPEIENQTINVLVKMGRPAIEPLREVLQYGTPGARLSAVVVLSKLNTPEVIAPLCDAL